MSDKKHIDRLFQEHFKDFEAEPSDTVWNNIEAQLNKKKKKHRVIPFWWRYAGVAALFLILLTVGNIYFNTKEDNTIINVVENEDIIKSESEGNEALTDSNKIEHEITNNDSQDKLEQESQIEKVSDKITPSNETTIAETTSSKYKNKSEWTAHTPLNKKETANNQVIKTENNNIITSNFKEQNSNKSLFNNTKNKAVVASNIEKDNEALKNENPLINTEKVKKGIKDASKNNSAIAKTNDESIKTIPDSEPKKNELSIEDIINDSKNSIEEEKKSIRWSIVPNAAPVYFNSLGEGSSIDPQFNSNSKSAEINMSYGIKASYAINKKLSVRSGVNKVNLGYNTNNVVVFQSVGVGSSAIAFQNVGPTKNSNTDNLSLISGENIISSKSPESFTTKSNTSLNQSLGYIEVPLEIQYALSSNKLGVNVIGGFSSFFLSENKIFSEAKGAKTFIGKANNINKMSYSANLGLGLNYKFSKKIDLNLEPMFKYQINTFNNTSGDFKPYFIGVYTGFAIKF